MIIHIYTMTFSVSIAPFFSSKGRSTHAGVTAFKSPLHLLMLSLSHALTQSMLLAHYKSQVNMILQHLHTQALPCSLMHIGLLALLWHDAMQLTGKLFALCQDVMLRCNVLDMPSIFWEEVSLHALYDAGRVYFEIGEHIQGLNKQISGPRDLVKACSPIANGGIPTMTGTGHMGVHAPRPIPVSTLPIPANPAGFLTH